MRQKLPDPFSRLLVGGGGSGHETKSKEQAMVQNTL